MMRIGEEKSNRKLTESRAKQPMVKLMICRYRRIKSPLNNKVKNQTEGEKNNKEMDEWQTQKRKGKKNGQQDQQNTQHQK